MRTPDEALEALARLDSDSDFAEFKNGYLRKMCEVETESLVVEDNQALLYRQQGRVALLKELLEVCDNAKENFLSRASTPD